MELTLSGTPFFLLPQRALFYPDIAVLIVADLHLGKAMHFRKSGIFIPGRSAYADYHVLDGLIEKWRPAQVWLLGDLFHSSYNMEWQYFRNFRLKYKGISFCLVKGNHDILSPRIYTDLNIDVFDIIQSSDFIFSHEPLVKVPDGKMNIAGHVHPGCMIRLRGRQMLRLPCFYRQGRSLLLPAFGRLTGLAILPAKPDSRIYAVFPEEVVLVAS